MYLRSTARKGRLEYAVLIFFIMDYPVMIRTSNLVVWRKFGQPKGATAPSMKVVIASTLTSLSHSLSSECQDAEKQKKVIKCFFLFQGSSQRWKVCRRVIDPHLILFMKAN